MKRDAELRATRAHTDTREIEEALLGLDAAIDSIRRFIRGYDTPIEAATMAEDYRRLRKRESQSSEEASDAWVERSLRDMASHAAIRVQFNEEVLPLFAACMPRVESILVGSSSLEEVNFGILGAQTNRLGRESLLRLLIKLRAEIELR